MTNRDYIRGYFRDRAVAFPYFYTSRPLLPIEAYIVKQIPRNGKVLDLCCGGGEVSLAMAKRGIDVVGVDNVPEMCELCMGLFVGKGYSGHFHVAEATSLPYDDCSFSFVVCTGNSLNSMDNETAELTIQEATRVVKPDGVLYFTVLNPLGLRNILAVIKGIVQHAPRRGFYYHSNYGLSPSDQKIPRGLSFLISPHRLKRYMKNAGLEYESMRWRIGFVADHLLLTCRKVAR